MVYRRSAKIRRPRRSGRPTTYRRRRTPARSYGRQFVTRPGRVARAKTASCVCPGDLTPSAKFALAQIDPFDPRCLGAKIPDSNTMPSLANADTDQVSITSGTDALTAVAFYPSYQNGVITATNTAGVITWPNANFVGRRNATNIINNLEAIRPVAHAIRLSSSLSSTSATGFVHIGLSVETMTNDTEPANQMPLPKTVNDMTGLAHYKRFTLSSLTQSPLTVINKWIDDTAFRYLDPRTPVGGGQQASSTFPQLYNLQLGTSWAAIVVMVDGPVSASVLSAEHLLLTEALPKKNSFIIGSAAAPNSPGTISAVSAMQSETDFAHTEDGQQSYQSRAVEELSRGAQAAGEAVYRNVAAPLLNRLGQAAVHAGAQVVLNRVMGVGGIPGVNANPNRLALTT